MMSIGIEELVDEMLECLDIDIEHIKQNLSRLNELRSLVIKRDDDGLRKIFDSIHTNSESYNEHEMTRHVVRKKIADFLGCNISQVTLSILETKLDVNKKNQVKIKKEQLKSLVEIFKREYANTIVLVSECARFNRLMIKNIFNYGKAATVVYDAKGTINKQKDHKSWLVNCDL
jgi:polyhydroxyalkanoate synthesis regulator protein